MSGRKIIQENGMTMKIVQFCNESECFKKAFLELFKFNIHGDADYIAFTGDKKTDYGQPDITIRFNDGSYCYIEVKTDSNTDFQDNQTEGYGYASLIIDINNVAPSDIKPHVESHFCFLLDPVHYSGTGDSITIDYDNNVSFDVPVVSWDKIYNIVKDFGKLDLVRDIEQNVSGIKDNLIGASFSAYDMALLYNCKLLKASIKRLLGCNFNHINIIKKALNGILVEHSILNSIKIDVYDDYYGACIRGQYFSYNDKKGRTDSESIFLGFSPELLSRKVVFKNGPAEKFLCSVAVNKDLINVNELKKQNILYCEDEYRWIYIPADNYILNPELKDDTKNCCSASTANLEYNLDMCHSVITLYKMQNLIRNSGAKIVKRLNEEKSGMTFSLGSKYYYTDSGNIIYCGNYINTDNKKEYIYFGLAPNVFDERPANTQKNPDNVIISDFFSSVAIYIDDNKEKSSIYINNGAEFNNNWVYFPVCRKLLCCDNFTDLYVERIVKLIKEGIMAYW